METELRKCIFLRGLHKDRVFYRLFGNPWLLRPRRIGAYLKVKRGGRGLYPDHHYKWLFTIKGPWPGYPTGHARPYRARANAPARATAARR